ncbi:hypothetical protein [Streptomyces dysideae]|nr:hypothetical protein [Streptomyces dysideae]
MAALLVPVGMLLLLIAMEAYEDRLFPLPPTPPPQGDDSEQPASD